VSTSNMLEFKADPILWAFQQESTSVQVVRVVSIKFPVCILL
jgi:hypothetical protein